MKLKRITTYLLLTLCILCGSCRRASDNGKIDGYWKIYDIYYTADGTTSNPEDEFISIQLELLQLQNPLPSPQLTGVLSYKKGDDTLGVDFRNNPSDEILYDFGFIGPQCVLHIDRVDGSNLVLSSPIARITCKKY